MSNAISLVATRRHEFTARTTLLLKHQQLIRQVAQLLWRDRAATDGHLFRDYTALHAMQHGKKMATSDMKGQISSINVVMVHPNKGMLN